MSLNYLEPKVSVSRLAASCTLRMAVQHAAAAVLLLDAAQVACIVIFQAAEPRGIWLPFPSKARRGCHRWL